MSTYTNKAYVAFDADNDIRYYRLMQAWRKTDGSAFGFYDAHDLNNLMPYSSEETIKAKLRERLSNTRVFLLLVGNNTKYLYKFVRWEIEQAIKKDIPIVVVNLNGKRDKDDLCPAILTGELAVHVSFNKSIVAKAIREWPEDHKSYRAQGKTGAYHYGNSIYTNLGL
ncbi:MAG: TIR domain-containing protein [Candidatus Nomurabacteria bacterium]|nr:TIR domain-containing protein [Candidatus Nomurabacteria bacterium]USN87262.1 MAG: TIR domain-containing protein [Candidatus Nomurabacteria bacterium]